MSKQARASHRGLSDEEAKRMQALVLHRDGPRALTRAEEEELDNLLEIERREHDRKALFYILSTDADSYARKMISRVTREITDRAKTHSEFEKSEIAMVHLRFTKERSELETATRKSMQKLQGQHNSDLKELQDQQLVEEKKIRDKFRSGYASMDGQLHAEVDGLTNEVSVFIESIQELELDQLRTLQSEGTWQDGSSENEDPIVVPGTKDRSA